MTIPTTVAELEKVIEADWPVDAEDAPAMALIHVWRGPSEGSFAIPHLMWTSDGVRRDGAIQCPQKYFNEAHAVVAFWHSYRIWFAEQRMHLDRKPVRMYWRERPRLVESHGVFHVAARFATVWRGDDGLCGPAEIYKGA